MLPYEGSQKVCMWFPALASSFVCHAGPFVCYPLKLESPPFNSASLSSLRSLGMSLSGEAPRIIISPSQAWNRSFLRLPLEQQSTVGGHGENREQKWRLTWEFSISDRASLSLQSNQAFPLQFLFLVLESSSSQDDFMEEDSL